MKHTVSIIIPIYNVAQYLPRCMDSVINQTHTNLEIICVNDCSPDNSLEILKVYTGNDNRIKIINRKENGGLSAARNSGIIAANGEYIYFLDSDDWIDKDYIESMVEAIERSNTDIVLNTNIILHTETSSKTYEWSRYKKQLPKGEFLNKEYAINKTQCMVWCHIYRKKFFDQNHLRFPEGYIHEDEYFQHTSIIKTDKIYAFQGSAYHYFQRNNSIMSKKKDRVKQHIIIAKLIRDYYINIVKYYIDTKIFPSGIFDIHTDTDFMEVLDFLKSIDNYLEEKSHLFTDYEKYCIKNILASSSFENYQKKVGKNSYLTYITRERVKRKNSIKVSIIIPIYNVEPYLEKCLDSVVNQTMEDIEVICVDDCSLDSSLEILKEYAKNDNRIKIISFKTNKGAAFARNAGIDIANGEYIGFVDSDDYIDLDFYERLYKKAIQTDSDMVKSNLKYINWNKPSNDKYYNLVDVKIDKVKFNHFSTAVYRTAFLNKNNIRFPDNLQCAEDSVFEVLAAIKCNRIEIEESVAYYYVFRDESLNHVKCVKLDKIKEVEKSVLAVIDIFNNANISPETYITGIETRFNYLSTFILDKDKTKDVENYVIEAEDRIKKLIKYPERFNEISLKIRAQEIWKKKFYETQFENQEYVKALIDKSIKNFNVLGVTNQNRNPKFIISLTSFPDRMNDIHYCLYSLLDQSIRPDKIILWLGEEQFPNGENDIPQNVLNLKKNGLSIEFTHDTKSYKKLIPALDKYPNDIIITADDDILYKKNWFKKLYKEHKKYPNDVLCHRAHKIVLNNDSTISPYKKWKKLISDASASCLNFATGAGGILYPPNTFYKDIKREDLFMKLARNADDIWFWAMTVLNQRKIRIISEPYYKMTPVDIKRETDNNGNKTLYSVNIIENDKQLNNVIHHYNEIIDILSKERSEDSDVQ